MFVQFVRVYAFPMSMLCAIDTLYLVTRALELDCKNTTDGWVAGHPVLPMAVLRGG